MCFAFFRTSVTGGFLYVVSISPNTAFLSQRNNPKKLGAVQVNTARYTRRLEFILETALHATQCALHERLPAADITDSTIATLK